MNMDNIYTSVYPFYCLSKIFGLFPHTFEGPVRNGKFNQTVLDIILSCLSLTLLVAVIGMNLVRTHSWEPSSSVLKVSWDLTLLPCVVSHIASFVFQVVKRGSIMKFLSLLDEFDIKVTI